jgi:hypothetical protein
MKRRSLATNGLLATWLPCIALAAGSVLAALEMALQPPASGPIAVVFPHGGAPRARWWRRRPPARRFGSARRGSSSSSCPTRRMRPAAFATRVPGPCWIR